MEQIKKFYKEITHYLLKWFLVLIFLITWPLLAIYNFTRNMLSEKKTKAEKLEFLKETLVLIILIILVLLADHFGGDINY
jgi:hypothetical protein